ncbi:MAG: type II CAAX endopeptidase family protein [Dyadobacter sp.]|uniref:CPBP family intramembrane glutamic endopeptidase n=1 Tax=Dyadobacter sp. TaxID=1914288 RepID=UPI0032652529
MTNDELRPVWKKIFDFNWKFGLFLIIIICVPRFLLVLHANTSGNYGSIGAVMLVSAIAPFVFLTKLGRREIGIIKPKKYQALVVAFIAGLAFSLLFHWLGKGLYGNTFENWYQYIGRSYKIPTKISPRDKEILFTIMAITGMIFSPIGEELFFRGIVHASFAQSIGDKKASLVDSSAFALTHISHFGLVFIDDQWRLLLVPTLIWILGMFIVSQLFLIFKRYAGSILGAIFCHAAFNLGMIYCIFYLM